MKPIGPVFPLAGAGELPIGIGYGGPEAAGYGPEKERK